MISSGVAGLVYGRNIATRCLALQAPAGASLIHGRDSAYGMSESDASVLRKAGDADSPPAT